MGLYDLIFKKLEEKCATGELTFEEASVLNDLAYAKYVAEGGIIDSIQDVRKEQKDVNQAYKDAIKKATTEYKKEYKNIKKMSRKCSVAEAVSSIRELDDKLSDLEKAVNNCPEGVASETLTYCARTINETFKSVTVKAISTYLLSTVLAAGVLTLDASTNGRTADEEMKLLGDQACSKIKERTKTKVIALIIASVIASIVAVPLLKLQYGTTNEFKIDALKAIKVERQNCLKLEQKLRSKELSKFKK